MQQLQVIKREKKSQLWVEFSREAYIINWSLLFKVEQDDEYIVIKSLNSDEEYKMILFSSDDKLSEN